MATGVLSKATQKGRSWQWKGTVNGKQRTISGGQKGVKTGSANKQSQKTFDARHDVGADTPKKFINRKMWNDNKPSFGSKVSIPDRLFKK